MTRARGKTPRDRVPKTLQQMIKAPARNIKGMGPLGLFEGGLTPGKIDPKYGDNPKAAKAIIRGLGGSATGRKR